MNLINYTELKAICDGTQNISILDNDLIINEKGITTKININKMSSVRLIKTRVLFINYLFVTVVLLTAYMSKGLIASNDNYSVALHSILISIGTFSFFLKKYNYSLLINTSDLNFKKIEISKSRSKSVSMFENSILQGLSY
ncbi:MAG: hypothetical protein I4O51_05435 [Flavobacterium micromati]|nr:hypothetical protein [Flavobacterium micromati]